MSCAMALMTAAGQAPLSTDDERIRARSSVVRQTLFVPAQDSHFGPARPPLVRIRRSEQRNRLRT